MDIRNWPLGQVMQLPDHCFGRRFPVCVFGHNIGLTEAYDIAEIAFPEQIVVWELMIAWSRYQAEEVDKYDEIRLALGDQLPTAEADFLSLEPFMPGLGEQIPEPRTIVTGDVAVWHVDRLKYPIHTMGRRLVLFIEARETNSSSVQVITVVSSIPKEIPDCLLASGRS